MGAGTCRAASSYLQRPPHPGWYRGRPGRGLHCPCRRHRLHRPCHHSHRPRYCNTRVADSQYKHSRRLFGRSAAHPHSLLHCLTWPSKQRMGSMQLESFVNPAIAIVILPITELSHLYLSRWTLHTASGSASLMLASRLRHIRTKADGCLFEFVAGDGESQYGVQYCEGPGRHELYFRRLC